MAGTNSDSCTDPSTGTNYTTRNQCSLVGLKTLLLNIAPCTANYTTCPSGGVNAVDMVSVFVFPNFQYSTGANAYTEALALLSRMPRTIPSLTWALPIQLIRLRPRQPFRERRLTTNSSLFRTITVSTTPPPL